MLYTFTHAGMTFAFFAGSACKKVELKFTRTLLDLHSFAALLQSRLNLAAFVSDFRILNIVLFFLSSSIALIFILSVFRSVTPSYSASATFDCSIQCFTKSMEVLTRFRMESCFHSCLLRWMFFMRMDCGCCFNARSYILNWSSPLLHLCHL